MLIPKVTNYNDKVFNPLAAAGPCRDQSSKILETLAVATVMVESSCNLAWRYSTPTPSPAQWQTADLFYSWAVAAEQTAVSGKNELCYPFHEWSSFEKVLFSNKSSFLFLLLYCDILKKLSWKNHLFWDIFTVVLSCRYKVGPYRDPPQVSTFCSEKCDILQF